MFYGFDDGVRQMSETSDLSPEEWAHELHYMANAGFGDLARACDGLDPNG